MKIAVRDITADGLEISGMIAPAEIGVTPEDFTTKKPFQFTLRLERIQNAVSANVRATVWPSYICDRCLEEFDRPLDLDMKFNYMVNPSDQYLELGEDARQEIILNLPLKHLCRDDCRGLCAKCGVNLNNEKCKCQ